VQRKILLVPVVCLDLNMPGEPGSTDYSTGATRWSADATN
jgi:hypothetical protein